MTTATDAERRAENPSRTRSGNSLSDVEAMQCPALPDGRTHRLVNRRSGVACASCSAAEPVLRTQAEALAALTRTPTPELLTKAYALTHRLHDRTTDEQRDLRAARDLITAEVLRRTGETG